MPVAALILVEPSQAGNLGAVMRIAANFGVCHLELVRPAVDPDSEEVRRWACGGDALIECRSWARLADAAADYRTLAASASGRGRRALPVLSPREAIPLMAERGLDETALVFGNETRGLCRADLDCCDMVIRIPSVVGFPVLNLAQAVAILVSASAESHQEGSRDALEPAPQAAVEGLMAHLRRGLLAIGFLDPRNPQRILRKLRRLLGRAGVTAEEVRILRGICRQMEWAAGQRSNRSQHSNKENG
jgi:tRNA/rRNA methyltransferase